MNRMDAHLSQDGSHGLDAPSSSLATRMVAFMNQKGGVGKTTTTVNVGAALARHGRSVLLVDLDPQAHSTLHLGIEPDEGAPTVYDLLLDADCSVLEVIHQGRRHLDIIPAEVGLAAAEVELTTQPGREMILREKLESVAGHYDYILFDCPPSLGLLTLNALVASHEVVIPMQAHFLPLQGVGKLLETISLVRQRLNRALRVAGIVLCSHDGQTTLAKEIVADLEAFFEQSKSTNAAWESCTIFEPPIRRNIKLAEAPSFGQTIFEYARWCAGSLDYNALAENLLLAWEGAVPPLVDDVDGALDEAEKGDVTSVDEAARAGEEADAPRHADDIEMGAGNATNAARSVEPTGAVEAVDTRSTDLEHRVEVNVITRVDRLLTTAPQLPPAPPTPHRQESSSSSSYVEPKPTLATPNEYGQGAPSSRASEVAHGAKPASNGSQASPTPDDKPDETDEPRGDAPRRMVFRLAGGGPATTTM